MAEKTRCCERFLREKKACKGCPQMSGLGKKKRRKRIKKLRQKKEGKK